MKSIKPLETPKEQPAQSADTFNWGQPDANLQSFHKNLGFLSNATTIGLIITDVDGKIITYNKTIQDLLGFELDEQKPMNVSGLYAHPNDRKRLFKMLADEKTVRDFEVELKHKDGTLRTVLANVDAIEWNDEQVLLTSIYDITQSKQRYKMSENRYQILFSNAPVGITVTDVQGNLIVSNNAIRELLGYREDELKNVSIRDFYVIPADRQQLLKLTKQFGNARDFETMFRCKDGRTITVLVNTDIIEFNHRKDMLLTSIRDISGYKRIEDELILERDFSSMILNIATTLIVVFDSKGMITRFNHACEKITGYTTKEVCGSYLWETAFFDPVVDKEDFYKMLKEGHLKTVDTILVSKTGMRYSVTWSFAIIPNKEESVEYIVATGIDVTEQLKAKAALQKANQELGSRVEELQVRTEEMKLMNEMGEQLQSCQTIAEVCAISIQYLRKICPISSGALYLINESKDIAQAAGMWGEPVLTQEVFNPLSCWAIRRGHQHIVEGQNAGLLCGHITGSEPGHYLCAPLLVNGEAIGILHLNHINSSGNEGSKAEDSSYAGHKAHIITSITEHIALALSNLKLRETLRQQSIRDVLTGLFNRRYMEETLERELRRAERENKPVAVIMLDIDHFKIFNDTAGHDAGDALLHDLGIFLKQTTRGGDIVCRYGGEEFVVVLPNSNIEDAILSAEELRQGVKELSVYHLGKILEKCTISLGVAVFPENGLESKTLLKAADKALYCAKSEGRDRVEQA